MTSNERFKSQIRRLEREFIPLLKVADVDVQRVALGKIVKSDNESLKQEAMPMIAILLGSEDSDLRYAAASGLAASGESALPMIDAALQSKNPLEKAGGCSALRQMKPFPVSRLDSILTLLEDGNQLVRSNAITALGYVQPVRDKVLETLIVSLNHDDVQFSALRALERLGASASEKLGDLYPLLDSDDARLRIAAARTVWKISGDVDRVLPVLREIVRDDKGVMIRGYSYSYSMVDGKRVKQGGNYSTSISGQAARVLGEMGPDAAPAVQDLVQRIQTDDYRLSSTVLGALGGIGPAASSAVPRLLQFAEEHEDWRRTIRMTVHRIDPEAAKKLPLDEGRHPRR